MYVINGGVWIGDFALFGLAPGWNLAGRIFGDHDYRIDGERALWFILELLFQHLSEKVSGL